MYNNQLGIYTGGSPYGGGPGIPTGPTLPGGIQLPPFDWDSAPDWWELGQQAKEIWEQTVGGSGGGGAPWSGYDNRPFTQPCPGTPSYDAVARAVAAAPQPAIDQLIQYLRDANQGKGPKTRAELAKPQGIPYWTKAILGGKGCVASKFPEAPDWFRSFVAEYGAPQDPGDTEPGSGIDLPPVASANIGVALAAAAAALFFVPRILGRR